ncbi:hypothetical protein AB7M17_001875 [Bradyrhizobium sp. USDA 377]
MSNRIQFIQWIVPLTIGVFGFLGSLYAILVEQRSDWSPIALAVISTALSGAGIFNTVSFTKGGIIIKTAQANLSGLSALEKTVTLQADTLQQLSKRIEEIAVVTVELSKLPQASLALTAQAEALSVEPNDLTSALQSLGASVNDVAAGVSAAKKTIGSLVEYLGWSNDEPVGETEATLAKLPAAARTPSDTP